MGTSVVLMGGNSSDHHHLENHMSREMEMSSLIMNGPGGDQKQQQTITRTAGKPGRRKKSKQQSELAQKKKTPQRGMGVEQLERIRVGLGPERKMTPHFNYSSFISHHQAPQQQHFSPAGAFMTNGGSGSGPVGVGGQHNQTPVLLQFQGFNSRINYGHGPHVINSSSGGVGPLFSDETFLSHHDPFAAVGVGSRFRAGNGNSTEASKELSSIPNNMKWYSEQQCGFCLKKFRGTGETTMCNGERKKSCGEMNMSPVNGLIGSFAHVGNKGNMFNGGTLNYFASQTTPVQEVEVKEVHSTKGNSNAAGGGSNMVMEYDFFPGKSSSSSFIKQQEMVISLKTEAASSVHEQAAISMVGEASSSSAAAAASSITSHHLLLDDHHDDQNSNSIDLSLRLSSYI